ncbi:hypothetical protein, partial [Streptococcus suis]
FNPLWQEKQVLDGKSYLQQTQLAPSQQVAYYQSLSGMLLAPQVVTRAWQRRTDLPGQLLTRFLLHSQASLVYLPEVAYISSNSRPDQT